MPTINFHDHESDDEGIAIVRGASEGRVALAISLRHDGDIEVVLDVTSASAVAAALADAVEGVLNS